MKKRMLLLIGSAILCFMLAACQKEGVDSPDGEPNESNISSVSASKTEPTTESEVTPATNNGNVKTFSMDELCTAIKNVFDESSIENNVAYDGTTVIANIWIEGLAEALSNLQKIGGDYSSSWNSIKETTKGASDSICNLIDICGREDVSLVINVLNDIDRAQIFLTMVDGTIILDAFAQS